MINIKPKVVLEALPLKNYVYASLGLSAFMVVLILALKSFLPPQLPLFYGNVQGESQLTTSLGIIIAPIASIVITLINIAVSASTKEVFLKKVLSLSSFFVSILTTITIVRIILLVGIF